MSREYVVLRLVDGESDAWQIECRVTAASAAASMRGAGPLDGLYVAVPARQWKPLRVTVEQTVRVKVTEEPVA